MKQLTLIRAVLAVAALAALAFATPALANRVLRVGSYHGIPGQYDSIQAAVDAAKPGDTILIGPGDYHERADHSNPPHGNVPPSGVLITKDHLQLRGMDRNKVVVDGTKPGAKKPCSSKKSDQDFGLKAKGG